MPPEPKVEAFLTHLAVDRNVAPAIQNQAMNVLVFLYKRVLSLSKDGSIYAVRIDKKANVSVVMTWEEVDKDRITTFSHRHRDIPHRPEGLAPFKGGIMKIPLASFCRNTQQKGSPPWIRRGSRSHWPRRGGSNNPGKAKPLSVLRQLPPPLRRYAPHPLLSRGGEFSCNPAVSGQ
jgi:hypothetical protein